MAETKSSWVTAKPEEVKEKIIELAKQGMSPEKIGLVLRDQHGIPKAKALGLRVKKVLVDAKRWEDTEKKTTEAKVAKLSAHMAKHKHDNKAKRSLMTHESRIHSRIKRDQKR